MPDLLRSQSFQRESISHSQPLVFRDKFKESCCQRFLKVSYLALSILLFPLGCARLIFHCLHRLVGRKIVGISRAYDSSYADRMCQMHGGEKIKLITRDQVEVQATYLPGKDALPSSSSVIIFCGMDCYDYDYYDVVKMYQKQGMNVLLFNYRGRGESRGYPTQEGVVKDGEAAVRLLNKHFNVPLNQITLHGHSFGGGVAAAVGKRFKKVNLCLDRSFTSMTRCMRHLYGLVGAGLLWLLKWQYDCLKDAKSISGRKCVTYHTMDHLAPVSPYHAWKEERPSNAVLIEMREGMGKGKSNRGRNSHMREFFKVERDQLVSFLKA